MDTVVIASSEADGRAAEAVEQHHAQMVSTLAVRVEALVAAASARDDERAAEARTDLASWCEHELVPHALAEEKTMYPAAHAMAEARLLIDGMLEEHNLITGLVQLVAHSADPVRAAAAGKALQVAFVSHVAKENQLVLPLLVSAPDVSVAELVGGMHELLGAAEAHEDGPDAEHGQRGEGQAHAEAGAHGCTCGEKDEKGYPELDARAVPHAIRHATILGALDAVRPGGGLVLVAPHDPLPLLKQIEDKSPGMFEVSYLERGPAWRLVFVRRPVT